MKLKKFIFVPVILIIVSIITSIIAFRQTQKLNDGYIYINDNQYIPVYSGEYFAILGNIQDEEYYISIESLDEHLKIVTYDTSENIVREFQLIIKEKDQIYDKQIVKSVISNEKVIIDEMEDYLFLVYLDMGVNYSFGLSRVDLDGEKLNVALVNIPENIYNLKSLMESVSFTTLIFAIVSGFTIVAIYFIKRRSD
ncbi:MAG: hypothetical protein CVV60_01465 [Tenericutes bacterium HGW-Tenericutes-5]|nr:MAG: hypothetical protein CVV60_01465 [Tenericutes bacterium HGW-Tenericutes-5]